MPESIFSQILNRTDFSFERLITFLKVANAGGLTAAVKAEVGNALVKSDPEGHKRAINARMAQFSRQMSDLEECFGPLFDKGERQHLFTERGQELAAAVRLFVTGLEGVYSTPIEPVISLGANNTVLAWLVAPLLPQISAALPRYRFQLEDSSSTRLVNAVRQCSLDFALVRGKSMQRSRAGNSFHSKPIAEFGYSLFIPDALEAPDEDWKTLLRTLPIATLNREGEFAEELALQKIELTFKVGCNSFSQAKALFDTGKYAAILPDTARLVLKTGRRVPLPDMRREMVLIWNKHSVATKRMDERLVLTIVKILKDGMKPATAP